MSLTRTIPMPRTEESPRRQLLLWGIILVEALTLGIPWKWWGIAGISLVALLALLGLFLSLLRGRAENLILAWVLIFPLGYYFLSYPRESIVISFDRVMVLAAVLAVAFARPSETVRVPALMLRAGVVWAIFLAAAAISLVHLPNPLGGTKLWWDAFVLPALLGFCIIRSFDVRRFLPWLHLMTCLFAIYSVLIGIAEFVLNTDLLPLPSGTFYSVGETSSLVPRVNGPFATNTSYALIGLIAFLLLVFVRREMPERIALWRSLLHWLGVSAACLMAVMTLFRSVLLTLVVILVLDTFLTKGLRARILRMSILMVLLIGGIAFQILVPDVSEERSDPQNIYGRIAQQKQTLEVFLTHPITGIGLGNFLTFAPEFVGTAEFRGYDPVDAPHNNVGQIFAETGIAGGIPYVWTQMILLAAFWKVRHRNSPSSRRIWIFFLYIFLSYWISGLSLSSGFYPDLNLWFILALAVLYKFALTEKTTPVLQIAHI